MPDIFQKQCLVNTVLISSFGQQTIGQNVSGYAVHVDQLSICQMAIDQKTWNHQICKMSFKVLHIWLLGSKSYGQKPFEQPTSDQLGPFHY